MEFTEIIVYLIVSYLLLELVITITTFSSYFYIAKWLYINVLNTKELHKAKIRKFYGFTGAPLFRHLPSNQRPPDSEIKLRLALNHGMDLKTAYYFSQNVPIEKFGIPVKISARDRDKLEEIYYYTNGKYGLKPNN